jgi:hypothetical protein
VRPDTGMNLTSFLTAYPQLLRNGFSCGEHEEETYHSIDHRSYTTHPRRRCRTLVTHSSKRSRDQRTVGSSILLITTTVDDQRRPIKNQ